MTVKIKFARNRGIYGKTEIEGFKTCESSGFVVFRDNKCWSLGHERSGLSVESLLPRKYQRTKTALLAFVERMEAAEPEACADVASASGSGFTKYEREGLLRLVDWSRGLSE